MRKILIAATVGAVLLCGCGGFFGYRGVRTVEQVRHAKISQQQFGAVQLGQTEQSVRADLPQPLDGQLSTAAVPAGSTCIYYRTDGTAKLFRLCFRDGKLTDKRMVEMDGQG